MTRDELECFMGSEIAVCCGNRSFMTGVMLEAREDGNCIVLGAENGDVFHVRIEDIRSIRRIVDASPYFGMPVLVRTQNGSCIGFLLGRSKEGVFDDCLLLVIGNDRFPLPMWMVDSIEPI